MGVDGGPAEVKRLGASDSIFPPANAYSRRKTEPPRLSDRAHKTNWQCLSDVGYCISWLLLMFPVFWPDFVFYSASLGRPNR